MENKQHRDIQPADRLALVSEYYFSRKLKEVAQLNAEGKDIISLAIGSPDMPPSPETVEKLCEVARQPDAHGYQPTVGTPKLCSPIRLSPLSFNSIRLYFAIVLICCLLLSFVVFCFLV